MCGRGRWAAEDLSWAIGDTTGGWQEARAEGMGEVCVPAGARTG